MNTSPILAQPAAPVTEAPALPAPTPVAKTAATTSAKPPQGKATTPQPSLTGEVLLLGVLVGFIAAGAASMLRKKFPAYLGEKVTPFQTWLVCDTCISTGCTVAATAVWWYATKLPVTPITVIFFGSVALAGTAVCLVLLKLVQALTKAATS